VIQWRILRAYQIRHTIDEEIVATWRACSEGRLIEQEAAMIDEAPRKQRERDCIVVPLPPRSGAAINVTLTLLATASTSRVWRPQ
jgi:hypothetical protein